MHLISARVYSPQNAGGLLGNTKCISLAPECIHHKTLMRVGATCERVYSPQNAGGLLGNLDCNSTALECIHHKTLMRADAPSVLITKRRWTSRKY